MHDAAHALIVPSPGQSGDAGQRTAFDELLARSMVSGLHALKPRTHKHHKKIHKRSVSGTKLVDWVLKYGDMQSRDAAHGYCDTLLERGYLSPTPPSVELLLTPHSFVEQRGVYYQFDGPLVHKVALDPEQDRSRHSSVSASSSGGGAFSLRRRGVRTKSRDLFVAEPSPSSAGNIAASRTARRQSAESAESAAPLLSPRGTPLLASGSCSDHSSTSSASSSSSSSSVSDSSSFATDSSSESSLSSSGALTSSTGVDSWPTAKLYQVAGLTQSDLNMILVDSEAVQHECGDTLLAENAHFTSLCLLQRGRVSLLFLGEVLVEVGPGFILGVLPGLLSRRLPLRFKAESTVTCRVLDAKVFPRLERDHPELMLPFLRLLGLQVSQLLAIANQLLSETVSLSGAAFSCRQLRAIQTLTVREERLAFGALLSASFSGPQLSPVHKSFSASAQLLSSSSAKAADASENDGIATGRLYASSCTRTSAAYSAGLGQMRRAASTGSLFSSKCALKSASSALSPPLSDETTPEHHTDPDEQELLDDDAPDCNVADEDDLRRDSDRSQSGVWKVFALEPAGWAQLLPYAEERIYCEGEYLIRCGDGEDPHAGDSSSAHHSGADGLFQLLDGQAMVTLPAALPHEEDSLLTVLSPGQTVGEISWLTGMPPLASVVVSSPLARVLFLSRDTLTRAFGYPSHTDTPSHTETQRHVDTQRHADTQSSIHKGVRTPLSAGEGGSAGDKHPPNSRLLEASVAGFALEATAAKVQATLNALRRLRKSRVRQLIRRYGVRRFGGLSGLASSRHLSHTRTAGAQYPARAPTAATSARDRAPAALNPVAGDDDGHTAERALVAPAASEKEKKEEEEEENEDEWQVSASSLTTSAGAVYDTVDNIAVLIKATKCTLLDMLVSSSVDHTFVNAFLVTHSYFMTTKELIAFLRRSFLDGLDRCSISVEERSAKMKVLSVLKRLINWLGETLLSTPLITEQLKQFVAEIKSGPKVLHPFADIVRDAIRSNTAESSLKSLTSGTVGFLSCSTETTRTTVDPLSVPAEVLAKAMTQIEWELFVEVEHRELLHKRFEKKVSSPKLHRCTEYVNGVVQWAAETILAVKSSPQERSQVICKFIRLAHEFQKLNNFSGVLQIVGALGHCAIARLSQSFALVPTALQNILCELQNLVYPMWNYKLYRSALANATPPLLPIQGVTLKDLTSIEELPSISGKYVQFDKLQCIAAIVSSFRDIQQSTSYNFLIESVLRHSLKGLSSKEGMHENAMYQQSRKLESPSSATPVGTSANTVKKSTSQPSYRRKRQSLNSAPCVEAVNESGVPAFDVVVQFSRDPIWKTLGIHRSDVKVRMAAGNVAQLLTAFQVEISSTLSAPNQLLLRERLATAKLVMKRHKEHTTLSMSDEFIQLCLAAPDARLVLCLPSAKVRASTSGFEHEYKLAQQTVDIESLREKVRQLSTTMIEMQQLQRRQLVEFINIIEKLVPSSKDLKQLDLSPIIALADEAAHLMKATTTSTTTTRKGE